MKKILLAATLVIFASPALADTSSWSAPHSSSPPVDSWGQSLLKMASPPAIMATSADNNYAAHGAPPPEDYLIDSNKLAIHPNISYSQAVTPPPGSDPGPNVHMRMDQVVQNIAPNTKSAIPDSKPVLKALVDSRTEVTGTFAWRDKPKDPTSPTHLVATTKTTYIYLLEGGGHVELDSKVVGVRDLRNFILEHPKYARIQAFCTRWYDRAKPLLTPATIIANGFIQR